MKINFMFTAILLLSLFVSCEPGDQHNRHTANDIEIVTPEQNLTGFRSSGNDPMALQDTTLAFLRKELRKRKLLQKNDFLTLDSIDVKNSCYTLLQQSDSLPGKQSPKRWLYYPQTKTLVDVAGDGELSLADDGITKEDRDKMKNLETERLVQ